MTTRPTHTDPSGALDTLLRQLTSGDPAVRGQASRELAARGPAALEQLVALLGSRSGELRWEAARTLSAIGDPAATEALIGALDDQRGGVRWLAANGLIMIGHACLPHLLRALVDHPQDVWLRQGAHHVLRALGGAGALHNVLRALEGPTPWVEVPLAAYQALSALPAEGPGRGPTA